MEIDYVIPMVFCNDEEWLKDYRSSRATSLVSATDHVRYRSWGTEHLLVKCIKTFMPWIRDIHILLARESQIQPWMEEEGVKIVLHRHFIPPRRLPVFNSCTIEMFLPFIPDLAEHFIYGNDDMFPLSPLKEEDFFKDGLPCQHFVYKKFPAEMGIFHSKCKKQQEMVAAAFGQTFGNKWFYGGHNLAPLLLSSCKEARRRFDSEINSGITVKRSVTSYNQYLYSLWQYFKGDYVDKSYNRAYVSLNDDIEKVRKTIMKKNVGVVCINDTDSKNSYKDYAAVVREAIAEKLSIQSLSGGVARGKR